MVVVELFLAEVAQELCQSGQDLPSNSIQRKACRVLPSQNTVRLPPGDYRFRNDTIAQPSLAWSLVVSSLDLLSCRRTRFWVGSPGRL